jgi:hypothetical protein
MGSFKVDGIAASCTNAVAVGYETLQLWALYVGQLLVAKQQRG